MRRASAQQLRAGCPTGAKQGMHVTQVPVALHAAARLTHARVSACSGAARGPSA
jgi:hypothetical protein